MGALVNVFPLLVYLLVTVSQKVDIISPFEVEKLKQWEILKLSQDSQQIAGIARILFCIVAKEIRTQALCFGTDVAHSLFFCFVLSLKHFMPIIQDSLLASKIKRVLWIQEL